MANHSIATTEDQAPRLHSSETEVEHQNRIISPWRTDMEASGIVMRSLSNKVRVYSDGDASMDEGNSRRGSTNLVDPEEYRHMTRPTRLSEQEWHTMAKFAKAQGEDLVKQVEEQKRRQVSEHEVGHSPSPHTIAKSEMDEMRRLLKEHIPRDSEEYFRNIPTESERDSSPERVPRRKKHHQHHRHHHHNLELRRDYSDKHMLTDDDSSSSYRDSSFISSDINEDIKSFATEDPSKILDWLRGYGGAEPDKRIVLSEDRILSLLQALREGALGADRSLNDWVPMEKLREAERRSSAAEEQIRYFEQLFNVGEGSESGMEQEEAQLRSVLTKSKTMDRHFAHMKKFAEDRHAELRRMYSNISDKDVKTRRVHIISPSRSGLVSAEKAKKELQEHENHKKRLVQVFSSYNELLRLVRVEHAKRVDAENKSVQLTSHLKRQTATLKRAEKVIKNTALSPIMFNEPLSFNSRAPNFATSDRSSLQASPYNHNSARQSPSFSAPTTPLAHSRGLHSHDRSFTDQEAEGASSLHSKSPNNTGKITIQTSASSSPTPTISKQLTYDVALPSPSGEGLHAVPHLRLPASAAEDHRKEFQELEDALIEEGRSKGFADVDLYSEKKTVGKEETRWEYRHVHFDFTKPNQVAATRENEERVPASPASCKETLNIECLSSLPISRRATGPARTEEPSNVEEKCEDLQQSACHGRDYHLLSSLASYREGLERLNKQEDSKQMDSQSMAPIKLDTCSSSGDSPLNLDFSHRATAASSPLKLDSRGLEAKSTESEKGGDDVAKLDDVASKSDRPRSLDDVASDVGPERGEADVGQSERMPPNGDVSSKQMREGHGSSKNKSASDLQRRVAAIEAGNVAHRLHGDVKRRRRLLLVQVVLFGVALLGGVLPKLPSSLRIPPPT